MNAVMTLTSDLKKMSGGNEIIKLIHKKDPPPPSRI